MNKLGFLFFLSVLGCIKLERLEEREKVFSYDEFRTLVKKEDIAEYLSKNEYDFEQELEKGRDVLRILIEKDMEAEVLVLLDKLNRLKEEERVEFLSIGDGKEVLCLVVDKLWIKSTMKILDMYSKEVKQVRLGFGQGLNFNLLGRAVMNKNMQSLLLVLDLRRKYAKEMGDKYAYSCPFKINKKLSESLEKAYDLVKVRKADKASEVDKSIGEDSIFFTFLKECLKKKDIKGEVSIEEFLSNLEEEVKKEALTISSCLGDERALGYLLNIGLKQDEVDENGNTALIYSSYYGRVESAKILIEKGAAIDLANKYGETPLYVASENGHKEVVELLLEKGAALNLAGKYEATPLWIASSQGHREVVELLINKGASIDLADEDGWTPLYVASHEGKQEVVELLIEKGAAIDLVNNDGETSLYIASLFEKKEVVELLINKGAAIDLAINDGVTSLYIASQSGHKEVVKLLINKGASIDLADKDGWTPLCIASSYGHKEVVKFLMSKGADINKVNLDGKSILEAALLNKKEEVIEELLSSCFVEGKGIVLSSSSLIVNEGALNLFNREIRQNPILSTASFSKIYRILNEIYSKQFIKEVERDFDKSCTTKLVEIIDEVKILKELNEKEAKEANIKVDASQRFKYEIIDNLNKMFNKRRDLRANAIYDKFINSREVILNRRVKAGYYKDYTILMLEILKGDLDKVLDRVRELIKQGSDVNTADQNGNSCLALAVRKNLKEIVEELINNGAEINAVNKSGENALMIAIENNLVDMVKRLASLTDMNHEDIFKNTALMLAIKKIVHISPESSDLEKRVKDIEEIIDILIKSGAKVTKEVMYLLEEKKEYEVVEKFRLKLARIFELDL